jgi:hypothetical protein
MTKVFNVCRDGNIFRDYLFLFQKGNLNSSTFIPAQAGISAWIPAFAGMTGERILDWF